jgi:hypothetical protein
VTVSHAQARIWSAMKLSFVERIRILTPTSRSSIYSGVGRFLRDLLLVFTLTPSHVS